MIILPHFVKNKAIQRTKIIDGNPKGSNIRQIKNKMIITLNIRRNLMIYKNNIKRRYFHRIEDLLLLTQLF